LSSALSSSPSSPKPSFDLDYSIHDFEADPYPDSQYLYRRIEERMIEEGTLIGGRTLDVACGVGKIAIEINTRGGAAVGLEPSNEMIGLSRYLFPEADVTLVRGVAEALPFADATFDRIICQGALDHFVSPHSFMREAARIVRPGGCVIIALANYESLSCKLGRGVRTLAKALFRRELYAHRPYYEIPEDHFHKGELSFVRKLGGRDLALERCYGISMLWLLRAGNSWSWGKTLARMPEPLASSVLRSVDRVGYRLPALADMIVSIWTPRR
jgi:SAM-dependent methyltransferase